jgi:predicted nucleic acid-binding protein
LPPPKQQALLIDTSAWIEFLRPRAVVSPEMRAAVESCLESGRARICGVVIAELLQGARGNKEIEQLQTLIDTVASLEMIEADWYTAGMKIQQLKSQGLSAPITDAVIATIAQRHRIQVLTLDQHFAHLMPS